MDFVTFKDAVKANIEGMTICSWLDNKSKPYNIHKQSYDQLNTVVRIDKFQLLGEELSRFDELKWTIGD